MRNVKIKICGITNLQDALTCIDNGANALGFIFCKSKRKVDLDIVKPIIKEVPAFVSTVAVFMNNTKEEIEHIINNVHIDVIQFHGNENEEFCLQFNKKVIKSISISQIEDIERIELYPKLNTVALDTKCKEGGGSGKTFNWSIANEAKKYNKKIMLAGGLNPDNVQDAINIVHPYIVDVSSGVEDSPGKKNEHKIKDFIYKVREICYLY